MTKAFAYLRVSSQGQLEGDGFERQTRAIKNFARTKEIQIARWFREEGVSGSKGMKDRPALAQLVEALHSNGVKLVLIERLDRLARDLAIQEAVIGDLKRNGFEIISAEEPDLCSGDLARKLMRQVLGAFAEYERDMIVSKLRGARERVKAREGRCEGVKPFGHFEGEEEIIARMKALRSSGTGYQGIADALNTGGLKPRSGTKWHPNVVRRILLASC